METKAYLDTHLVVWLHDKEFEKISQKSREIIESHDLYVSEFVRLELKYLAEIGKLAVYPDAIILFLQETIGLQLCRMPLGKIISDAMKFSWTRDPFDRLITANAAADNCILLTKDKTIRENYINACF